MSRDIISLRVHEITSGNEKFLPECMVLQLKGKNKFLMEFIERCFPFAYTLGEKGSGENFVNCALFTATMENEKLIRARAILTAESKAVRNIPTDENLLKAVSTIVNGKGKVVTSGMGKAGIIARKVASTFSSTGTPSVFLHPGEAQHGDLGLVHKNDVLLVFSNSGKTREVIELVQLIHHLHDNDVCIISVTSHPESELRNMSSIVLSIGEVEEVCSLGMAPTTSTTAMLALGDVLCVLVMEEINFTKEDFLKRHHGGYLGGKHSNGK